MKISNKRLYANLALAVSMVFGYIGTSGAGTCSTSDVIIGGNIATSCGVGSTNNDNTPDPGDGTWSVNDDFAGGRNDWAIYEREEGVAGGLPNFHDGNTSAINLVSSIISDDQTSGTMTLNVFDPTLITLKDGAGTFYNWYYFSPIAEGTNVSGLWDASVIFGGSAVSNVTAYSVVPVPAAVWLFGSGLLGLVGVARRKSA